MTFLASSTRGEVLRRLRGHVRAEGRVVIGFGADRDYEFSAFLTDAREVGLEPELLLSTWDLRHWSEHSEFLVALLRPSETGPDRGCYGTREETDRFAAVRLTPSAQ